MDSKPDFVRCLRRYGVTPADLVSLIDDIAAFAEVVAPTGEPPYCADPKDAIYLHLTRCAPIEYLISLDHHLLDIAHEASVCILSPGSFLRRMEGLGVSLAP